MDLDSSENTTLVTGINMNIYINIYIKVIASIWIGVSMWCVVGAILEHYGVRPMYFMLAGYWIYPIVNYIHRAITD